MSNASHTDYLISLIRACAAQGFKPQASPLMLHRRLAGPLVTRLPARHRQVSRLPLALRLEPRFYSI